MQYRQPSMRLSHARLSALFGAAVALMASSLSAAAEPSMWKLQGWKTDFSKTSVKWNEILSGGPPKDGIPSIDKPLFMPLGENKTVADMEPVITLELNGEARVYPLRILMWHEIVNDKIGATPVSVTYCPLCNSAIVFDRRAGGKTLEFGTTGKLRKSDLVMYDRQTETWWQQFTGQAIIGEMLGTKLKIIPARLESMADAKRRVPKAKLLIPNNPEMRRYGSNPYVGYDGATRPFLYRGEMPDGIQPLARVVVIKEAQRQAKPKAVSLKLLREKGKFKLNGYDVSWRKGQASALDEGEIAKGRDVGTVIATKPGPDGKPVLAAYDVTFAFVFHAFHPDGEIIK
ncbi:MAG: DUF3179 domain-containing protein [Pseudomonadota bacterium]